MSFTLEQYGIWVGLAISDTSSVTAVGTSCDALMDDVAMAIVVKLTRTVIFAFVAVIVMAESRG
ncbi:MAG: YeiH family protein [Phascolarctobacterium sp.]|nr:YeiH family protein [Phascolarctobacterium sp.]